MNKLSFVIPVYKTPEQLLRNCLDSVLAYSLPMELICILDSPGDPCEKVLDEFAAHDCRIRIIKNESNRGVSYSRNRGLDSAVGDWVAFVDSDDEIIAKGYERAIERVGSYDISGCLLSFSRHTGEARYGVEPGGFFSGSITDDSVANKLVSAFDLAVYPMIFRREIFGKYNIRFKEGHRFGEDYMVVTQLLCTGARYGFLNVPAYKSVGHDGSTCHLPACPERYLHGLSTILSVMRQAVAVSVCCEARRRYVACNIPLTLIDRRSRLVVKGGDRTRYLALLAELSQLMLGFYRPVLRMPTAIVFRLIGAEPRIWFCPGMPLSFILRILCHFNMLVV